MFDFFDNRDKCRKPVFLAVQDSSISDIVGRSVPWSEPTNNQSKKIESDTTVTVQ